MQPLTTNDGTVRQTQVVGASLPPMLPPAPSIYYHVLYSNNRHSRRHKREYRDGCLELAPCDGGKTRLVLMSESGGLLVSIQRHVQDTFEPGEELDPVGRFIIEFGERMTAEVYHSGEWTSSGLPPVADELRQAANPARALRSVSGRTGRAVHAIRTIGAGRQPTLDLSVPDLQRAIRTEMMLCSRLVRERDSYQGRVHELETQNAGLRARLDDLSAVAELLDGLQ